MEEIDENDKTLSFVKRWIKAFNRIFQIFGKKEISSNEKFVDTILKEEKAKVKTQEEIDNLAEKRKLLVELCDDVDTYYEKKALAEKATDLDDWFHKEVNTFTYDTIPDATQKDVEDVEKELSTSMDTDIKVHASLLESEFSSEELEASEDKRSIVQGNE